ncbi:receptor protein-tyrosine kinase CEPR2 [Tanacetum coccineum]
MKYKTPPPYLFIIKIRGRTNRSDEDSPIKNADDLLFLPFGTSSEVLDHLSGTGSRIVARRHLCSIPATTMSDIAASAVIVSSKISPGVSIGEGLMYASHRNSKMRQDTKDMFDDEKGTKNTKWKLENYHQIKFDADELCDLDEGNLIGVGGTGKVYRVDSKTSGLVVAVKQIWKGNKLQVMTAEIGILGKTPHRNILKVYACLVKGGSSFFVFEHMVNGNLYEALGRVVKNGLPELDWF